MANSYDDLVKRANGATTKSNDTGLQGQNANLEKDAQSVQQSMFVARDTDPSTVIDSLELSKRQNIPAPYIQKNIEQFKKVDAVNKYDYRALAERSKATTKFLQDPSNAALAKHDVQGLQNVEDHISTFTPKRVDDEITWHKEYGEAFGGGWTQMKKAAYFTAVAHGMMQPDEAIDKIFELNKEIQKYDENKPDYVKQAEPVYDKEAKEVGQAFGGMVKDTKESYEKGKYFDAVQYAVQNGALTVGEFLDLLYEAGKRPKATGYKIMENLIYAAPSIGLGLAGGASGGAPGSLAGTFVGSTGVTYMTELESVLQENNVDVNDRDSLKAALNNPKIMNDVRRRALQKGATVGAVETLFSYIGMRKAAKTATKAATEVLEGGAKKTLLQTARHKVGEFGGELAVESAGEGLGETAGEFAKHDLDINKLGEAAEQGAIESIFAMGQSVATVTTVNPVAAGVSKVRSQFAPKTEKAIKQTVDKAADAVKTIKQIESIQKAVDEIDKLENVNKSPEKVKEFVDHATGGDDGARVFFQPDEWDNYWNSKGKSPADEAARIHGDGGKKYYESKQTGNLIDVPVGKVVSDLAADKETRDLVNIARFGVDNMSSKEAQEHLKNLNPLLQALIQETLNPAEPSQEKIDAAKEEKEIEQNIYEQLKAAGRPVVEARTNAKFAAAIFNAIAQRSNKSAKAIFDKWNLKINGPDAVNETGAGETVLNQDDTQLTHVTPNGTIEIGVDTNAKEIFDGSRGNLGQTEDAAEVRQGQERIEGLPESSTGPIAGIKGLAKLYSARAKIPYKEITSYKIADPERGAKIAKAFEDMQHAPNDPEVQRAYHALVQETLAQYQIIKESGLVIEMITEDMENPYPNGSSDMFADIQNGHLWFFPTDSGFGDGSISDNPLLEKTGEKIDGYELRANDVFRIVHDIFGHAQHGFGFGPNGEESAYQAHRQMYSELAGKALATETRGQNSWVNFGPYGEANRKNPAKTKYADQKTGLLPDEAINDGVELSTGGAPDTPEFKAWFGDSKVVDDSGKPIKVAHGGLGATDIEIFDTAYSGLTTGNNTFEAFHFTNDPDVAQDYSRQAFNRRYQDDPESLITDGIVKKIPKFKGYDDQYAYVEKLANKRLGTSDVYLSIKNPIVIDLQGERVDVQYIERLTNFAKNGVDENGEFDQFYEQVYGQVDEDGNQISESQPVDGIIIKNMIDDIGDKSRKIADQYIVWDNTKIKSINNRGTFDSTNPNIYYQSSHQVSDLGFYSKLEKTILEKIKGDTAQVAEIEALLSDVKADERKWSGIDEFLKGKKKIDKQELIDFLRLNQIEIKEVTLGGHGMKASDGSDLTGDNLGRVHVLFASDGDEIGVYNSAQEADSARERYQNETGDENWAVTEYDLDTYLGDLSESGESSQTKYGQYTLPGGENYREVLLTMPRHENSIGLQKREEIFKKYQPAVDAIRNEIDRGIGSRKQLNEQLAKLVEKRDAEADAAYKLNADGPGYTSPHFDEKNILAHVRLNDRVDADGKRVLFVEEIQSDWHQAGRKKGYKGDVDPSLAPRLHQEFKDAQKVRDDLKEKGFQIFDQINDRIWAISTVDEKSKFSTGLLNEIRRTALPGARDEELAVSRIGQDLYDKLFADEQLAEIVNRYNEQQAELAKLNSDLLDKRAKYEAALGKSDAVPDAPLKNTWHEFALKRVIRMAAEQGYDRVAWTTGEQQAERYDLSTKFRSISYNPDTNSLKAFDMKGSMVTDKFVMPDELDDNIGKDLATKLLASPKEHGSHRLTGEELKVPKKGMVDFYDKKIGQAADKLIKKFGGKVGEARVDAGEIEATSAQLANDAVRRELKGLTFDDFKIDKNDKFKGMRTVYVNGDKTITVDNERGSVIYHDNSTRLNAQRFSNLEQFKRIAFGEDVNRTKYATVHSLDITPELRDAALSQGFELFQENRGRIRIGADNKINIDLLKKANPSTFLHELGHFYLEILGDLAEAADASDQIKDDFKTLLTWFGVESRDQITVEHHEQFARGFEAYLMEGKAPSLKLRTAFHRFKTWLVSVYRKLANLNVELTPEVRNVMDRLVATEDEIAQAQDEYNLEPMFSDPAAFGLTGEKAERYLRAREDARMAAEELMLAKIMDGYSREREKWWKNKKKELRKEYEKIVNEMPIYKALYIMQRGLMADGTEPPDTAQGLKLDRQVLVEMYGADFVKDKLPTPKIYAREGGMHPEIVAKIFGFESADDMITQLVNMPPKLTYLDQMVDAKMLELYPDLMADDRELEVAALESIHNDKRAELLRLEMEHLLSNDLPISKELMRRAIKRMPSDKYIKEMAIKLLGNRQLKEIRPHLFLAAEKKAAAEAAKAFTAGDFDAAYTAKEKELLNHELYKAAIASKDKVKKKLDAFKKLWRKDAVLAKTRDMNFVNAARAILAEYGLGRTDRTALEYLEPMRLYDPEAYETMRALVDSALDGAGYYKNISLDKFNEMAEAVMANWDMSKASKNIEIDGKRITTEQAREELLAKQERFKKPKERRKYDEDAGKFEKTKSELLGLRGLLRRFEHWVSAMDGGDINGPHRKYLYQPISEGTDRATKLSGEVKRRIKAAADKIRSGMTDTPIEAPEIGFKFRNKKHLLGAIQHIGNASNKKKLLIGRGWGTLNDDGTLNSTKFDTFVERMFNEKVITKADMDFVQFLWDLNEELKPAAQRAYKKIFGFYFDSITAQEVVTPFGTYRGGYMPAKIDTTQPIQGPVRAYRIGDKQTLEQMKDDFGMHTMPYSGGSGFGKSRVDNFNKPLLLDIGLAGRHIDEVIRFAYIKPAVVDAAKIIMNDNFRASMNEIDDQIIDTMLIPALSRADKQRIKTLDGPGANFVMRMANYVRKNVAMQLMFANIPNIAEQVTGFFPALTRLPPGALMSAMGEFVKNPKKIAAQIAEKSVAMSNRMDSDLFEYTKEVADLFENKSKFENAQDFAQKHAYIGQSLLQHFMDIAIWHASYSEAVAAGKSELEAVRTADRDVRETQGSTRAMDISRGEANPFMRIFQMFYNFFNNLFNLNYSEFSNVYYSELGLKQKYARGFYVYMMSFGMVAIGSALVKRAAGGSLDDDDDGEYIDDVMDIFLGSQVKLATGMVPVVGPAVMSGLNRYNKNAFDDRVSASPAVEAVSTVVGAGANAYKIITADELKKRDVKDLMSATGIVLGLPIGAANRPVGYLMDVKSGRAQPTGPIDFTRGLMTGRPGGQ